MSILKTNSIQIGQSNTEADNFVFSVPTVPDGTMTLKTGTGNTVFAINQDNTVNFENTQITVPTISTATPTIIKISRSFHSYAALTSDNKIYTWGYNNSGQLGDGTTSVSAPIEVQFPSALNGVNIVDMQGGPAIYVLFSNGDLYGWGYNSFGQLGLGDTTNRLFPVLLNTNVAEIYNKDEHNSDNYTSGTSCIFIRKNDNTFWCAGYGGQGNLGLGNTSNQTTWTAIVPPSGKTISKIWNCSDQLTFQTFIKTTDNLIYACGYNGAGQLGIGNTTQQTSWVNVSYFNSISDVIDIQVQGAHFTTAAVYNNFTTVLTSSGNMYACGNNTNGALGNGTTTANTSFTQVSLTKPVSKIKLAYQTVYVIFTDNTYARWGYNGYGQLHNGTTTQSTSPIYSTDVIQDVWAVCNYGPYSYASTVFIKKDNKLFVCGYNGDANGYAGIGSTTSNLTTLNEVKLNNSDIIDILVNGSGTIANRSACMLPNNANYVYTAGYNVNVEGGYQPDNGNKTIFRPIVLE